ncbi:esterase [Pseudomonas sp. B6002]|uniref:esterase n=1 Tax=Pseudomonas sp. B6002 TaxID=2726978 RepID=UPI0015A12D74|nr:esterase [Pseudomonas sp. B6002]NVZ51007.1 esterase [Pseudomonas sp. B6002]
MPPRPLLIITTALLSLQAAATPVLLKDISSFHIGGQTVSLEGLPVSQISAIAGTQRTSNPNGDYQVGQMYVQSYQLEEPRARYPLLMWHGGGLTGVTWETRPDGQPGWQNFFMRRGHSTYVSDAYERGRASWPRTPELIDTEPEHRTLNQAWSMFRFGPDNAYPQRRTFPGAQFPVDHADQFAKQFVARWASPQATQRAQAAYDQLVEKVCPCVILAHSQGNVFAFNAALKYPDKIKAIVALEPAAGPDPLRVDITPATKVPHLVIWGDFIDQSPLWQRYRAQSNTFLNAVRDAGGQVDLIDLPQQGIRGNSHMAMMEKNADQVAAMIQQWFDSNGLMLPIAR